MVCTRHNHSCVQVISSLLYAPHCCALFTLSGPPFKTRRSYAISLRSVILLLLLSAGVESNPGPPRTLNLGSFNIGGASKKAIQIAGLIGDHCHDLPTISETNVNPETLDTIKNDLAPPGYNILHIYSLHQSNIPMHGLALIYSSKLSVHMWRKFPRSSSFELQVVNVKARSTHIVIVNIYPFTT